MNALPSAVACDGFGDGVMHHGLVCDSYGLMVSWRWFVMVMVCGVMA